MFNGGSGQGVASRAAKAVHAVGNLRTNGEAEQLLAEQRGQFQPLSPDQVDKASRRDTWIMVVFGFIIFAGIIAAFATTDEQSYVSPVLQPVSALAGLGFAVAAFFVWRKAWKIADTPTMEIAGLGPGTFEASGIIKSSGEPVHSWFTNTPCSAYLVVVEKKVQQGKNRRWVTVSTKFDGGKHFWLVDETGMVLVETGLLTANSGARKLGRGKLKRKYRFTEYGFAVDEPLWVNGTVTHERHGLVMGGRVTTPEGKQRPGTLLMAACEEKLLKSRNLWAWFMTILSALLLGSTTVWDRATSIDPEHFGQTTLVVREGGLLWPFLIVLMVLGAFWIVSYFVRLYNRLIGLRNQASAAWSNIEVASLQRHDLIVGLTAAAQGAAAHEREVLEIVARRESALAGDATPDLPSAQTVGQTNQTLAADAKARSLIARSEAVPELKSSAAFQQLFAALVQSENRIAAARRYYNDAVILLADRSTAVPGNLLAGMVVPNGPPPPLTFDPTQLTAVGVELSA